MSENTPDLLSSVAASISDGAAIEWEQVAQQLAGDDDAVLGELQLLERIARFHKAPSPDHPSDVSTDGESTVTVYRCFAVSTASDAFIRAARDAPGWRDEQWVDRIAVPMTTLDTLIARHGTPAFVKIDVEGLEADVLAGLTRPVAALSFEFTTIQREVALACLARCAALGYVRFNAALGEQQQFAFEDWRSREEIAAWLRALPPSANSGDIYAAMG